MNKDGGWGQEAPLTLEGEDSAMLPLSVLGQPLKRCWLTTQRGLSWIHTNQSHADPGGSGQGWCLEPPPQAQEHSWPPTTLCRQGPPVRGRAAALEKPFLSSGRK